jgi:hypothetical protein
MELIQWLADRTPLIGAKIGTGAVTSCVSNTWLVPSSTRLLFAGIEDERVLDEAGHPVVFGGEGDAGEHRVPGCVPLPAEPPVGAWRPVGRGKEALDVVHIPPPDAATTRLNWLV